MERWVEKVFLRLYKKKLISFNKCDLNIIFLTTREAKKINKTYRNKNYATDILSFIMQDSYADSASNKGLFFLGELVICPEVVKKNAKNHKMTYREELLYMVLHGILHLLGYDHEKSENEARRMFQLQDEIYKDMDILRERSS